jgi:hypothetical protein
LGFCGGRWLGFYVTPTVGLPKVRSSSWQSSIIPPPSPRALLLLLLTALQHLWQPFWRPPLPAALSHDPSVPDSCPARGEMGNTRGEMGKKRSGGTLSPATAGQFFKFLVAVTAKAPTTFCSRKKSRTKHWAGGRKLRGAQHLLLDALGNEAHDAQGIVGEAVDERLGGEETRGLFALNFALPRCQTWPR